MLFIYSFSWLCGAYGLIGPNEKIRRPHLFLTVKNGVKKSDARREIKDKFKCDPKKYFELLQEPERKPQIKYLSNHVSKFMPPTPPAPGGGVSACTNTNSSPSNPLRVPEENEEDNLPDEQGTGTITMFFSPDGQHYALTCFHVGCANDESGFNAAFNKVEDIIRMRSSLVLYANHAKEHQYYFTKRDGDGSSEQNGPYERNNNEPISFGGKGREYVRLGDFAGYHFDKECDILSLKIYDDIKINCRLEDVIYPNTEEMWTKLNNILKSQTPVMVEKIGFSSDVTYGRIAISNFTYFHKKDVKDVLFENAIVVEGCSVPFLQDGDSGCPVFLPCKNNQIIAFAYGVCEVDALRLPVQRVAASSSDSDGDGSSDEDWSYEASSAVESGAALKCNVDNDNQAKCKGEFKLWSPVQRVPTSSTGSDGDVSSEEDSYENVSSAGEIRAELESNVKTDDQADHECKVEFNLWSRYEYKDAKEFEDKQSKCEKVNECQRDGECKHEHEDENRDQNDNVSKVECLTKHLQMQNESEFEYSSSVEFEDDDNYESHKTREYEGDWSEDEFQDEDDADDQSSEDVVFEEPEEPPTGPYFICLRLDTALENLELQNTSCFNECASE